MDELCTTIAQKRVKVLKQTLYKPRVSNCLAKSQKAQSGTQSEEEMRCED